VGDQVVTASGDARPIRWLGHREIECVRYPNPEAVWPVRIAGGAFADGQPSRDLWVSPGHSILVGEVLIQAEKLVNGATIVQVPLDRLEYWHVELDSHDILLAEGLPAESYLDNGNRPAFVNGGDFLEAFPDFRPKHWADTCVPLVLSGPEIINARETLIARAESLGYAMTQDPELHVIADGRRIEPVVLNANRVAFYLPAECTSPSMQCLAFVPAHVLPDSQDRRELGVRVVRVQVDGDDLPLGDDAAFAHGWHGLESRPDGSQWRWCSQTASLPANARLVVLDIAGWGRRWTLPKKVQGKSEVIALFG
jgi:hypothetical protein